MQIRLEGLLHHGVFLMRYFLLMCYDEIVIKNIDFFEIIRSPFPSANWIITWEKNNELRQQALLPPEAI